MHNSTPSRLKSYMDTQKNEPSGRWLKWSKPCKHRTTLDVISCLLFRVHFSGLRCIPSLSVQQDCITFERFLEATGNHPRVHILYDPSHFVLQCLDYIGYLDYYKDHIKAFHVKDAEYHPSPRSGVYGGYQDWKDRPGRFRSAGDGQVDFKRIFSTLTQHGFTGWAVLEWEDPLKDSAQGAREGAALIRNMLIDTPTHAFDDFAGGQWDEATNRRILGLGT